MGRGLLIFPELIGQSGVGGPLHEKNGDFADNSGTKGLISFAPKEQLIPKVRILAPETDIIKASRVWPESILPLWSAMVTRISSGESGYFFFARLPSRDHKWQLSHEYINNSFDEQKLSSSIN